MSNIFFTPDSHYCHSNLCIGISKWDDKEKSCRNFQTLEEMNELIVKNINDTVGENDILYHLGDWSFGGIENIWEFRKRINCKNIYLVPGNHDYHIKNDKMLPNVDLYQWYKYQKYNSNQFYEQCLDDNLSSQELFTEILPQCHKLKIGKTTLILSHYPIEEWEDMGKGSIHLHGHSHHTKDNTELNMYFRRMDVGMDWNEFRPYSLDEILELNNRKIYKRYE